MSMKLPPGVDPNKVAKVDMNQLSQAMDNPVNQTPQQNPHYTQATAQSMGAPQPVQEPIKPANSPEVSRKVAESHPVLKSLLNQFGLKKNERLENKLYYDEDPSKSVNFLQSDYEEAIETWTIQEGQFKARLEGETEGLDWMQTLLASASVVGLNLNDDRDGNGNLVFTPIYEIFNIELLDNEKIKLADDKFDLSVRLRKLCAKNFAFLLITELKGFSEKILEFYMTKLKKESPRSSIDKSKEDKEQYYCPEMGCNEVLFEKPRLDATGKKLPYYCKIHGVAMEGILDLGESQAPSN